MLTYLDTALRISLHRLDVTSTSLSSLIKMTEVLKTPTKSGENPTDSFVGIIFEILSDALRLKSRVSSKTLTAMTEVRCHCNDGSSQQLIPLQRLWLVKLLHTEAIC